MKKCLILIILLALAYPLMAQEDSARDTIEYPLIPMQAITDALAGIKMIPSDISFRTDYVDRDFFRLAYIDSLTNNPLSMIDSVSEFTNLFFKSKTRFLDIIRYGHSNIEPSKYDSLIMYRNLLSYRTNHIKQYNSPDYVEYGNNFTEIDIVSVDQIIQKVHEFLFSDYSIKSALGYTNYLTENELYFLTDSFPELLLEDENDEFLPIQELDSLQKLGEQQIKKCSPICEKLEFGDLTWEFLYQIDTFDEFISEITTMGNDLRPLFDSKEWIIELDSKNGRIAIGGWGPNSYSGDYYFILDLGGDDTYKLDQHEGTQIIIDLAGDDTYIAREDYCLGSGFFGLGILYDKAGNDLYKAKNFSLGSGLFGVGILIDEAGHDTYFADTHTQGAGTFGIGLLIDRGGNDNYNCALYGQAFAGPDGFGALVDYNGNDNYFAGGKYKDFLRYEDHYLSLSQGFSYGFRPRMSGGMAFLIDSCGNDIYNTDIFGQGASYWYGLGALYDISGNDKYLSFQYAQGNGTHLSLGILMDKSGDDYYYAKGVSQGCGHDLAAGILIDYAGDDTYQSYDLCQAAGSANGVGIFIDYLGNDTYETQKLYNTQGYGNPRRDYGSIGLFMDLMGEDHYIGNGQNNFYWIIDSKWGIGLDTDFWEVSE